ncbi:hypothetical protein [Altererythrobacter aquiaggeris]|uniref:hypothetical protein n=1 Tax=Aestuarierythrobacter aquiaggeris TaxID=1898396 RepID=UPI00301683ED
MTDNLIRKGFIFAGLSNILGVLVCSRLLTSEVMMTTQPAVMGLFGLIGIILWGLAYIAVCKNYVHVRWLVGVFVIEKLAYVIAWLVFISGQSLGAVYEQDFLAGVFYTIYGANDFMFMLFFAYVFLKAPKTPA